MMFTAEDTQGESVENANGASKRIRKPPVFKNLELDKTTTTATTTTTMTKPKKEPPVSSHGGVSGNPKTANSTKGKQANGGSSKEKPGNSGGVDVSTKGTVAQTTAVATKMKIPTVDPKEKALDEQEERFIGTALRKKPVNSQQKKVLPGGQMELPTLNEAMNQSFLDISTPLCDWSTQAAKYIGCICKVYWDGEDEWYYSRILNYDPYHKKHYIFYFSDKTAEWINLDNEAVMVAYEMKFVQLKSLGLWPALVYWVSPTAMPIVNPNNHVCVEFFNEKNQWGLEPHLALPEHLNPLSNEFLPQKMSKKFQKCWEAAKSEKEAIDTIIDEVVRGARSNALKLLKGDDWLGLRVRASTHRVMTKAELKNPHQILQSAYCTGTVKDYCPFINCHFVVFDEPQLQPQWVDVKGKVELLIDPYEQPKQITYESLQEGDGSNIDGRCLMCHMSCSDSDGSHCIQCNNFCHTYCVPTGGLRPVNEGLKKGLWKCWDCCACHSCGETQWSTGLMAWNARRVDPTGPDKTILLCGICMNRFKHHKEFCTLCYKLYSDSPVLDRIARHQKSRSSNTSNLLLADDQSEDARMVQCNACERWVHAKCEGIDEIQYSAISEGTHPIWGDEYLCPICRVILTSQIIDGLKKCDHLYMFAEPVTTSVAANYFDIIRNPMDLSTMRGKNEKGLYKSLQAVRQDVELMCCNALVFNRVGDEFWIAARTFYLAAMDLFQKIGRKTVVSAYGKEAEGCLEKWQPPQAVSVSSKKRKGASNQENGEKAQKLENGNKKVTAGVDGKKKQRNNEINADAPTAEVASTATVSNITNTQQEPTPMIEDDDGGPQFISIQQVPNPDPSPFAQPFTSLLTAEEAVYAFCQDQCFSCGSVGLSSNFVFCIDCGEAYHNYCAMTPKGMTKEAKASWRCVNCKICEVCGIVTDHDSETLVFCESCDQTFHMHCLTPALSATPEFQWYCSSCVHCQFCGNFSGEENKPPVVDKEGNPLKAWSPSLTCCYICDVEHKQHAKMIAPSVVDESSAIGKSSNNKKKSSVEESEENKSTLQIVHYLTCFDCGNKFNRDAIIATMTAETNPIGAQMDSTIGGKRRSNGNAVVNNNNIPGISIDPYFWTCRRCERKKVHEWGCHLGESREALSLLKQVTAIQAKRYQQITSLKAHALKSVIEPLNVFRKCNGLYYLMMVLWASLRVTNIATNTSVVSGAKGFCFGKLMKGPLEKLTPGTQWISARSRRYLNYSRRRIHRHESHPLHVVGDNRPVHLPSILKFSTEAMARLAQMASTFLFSTENEQYNEDHQIRELVLVLIQVSFLLLHDSPTPHATTAATATTSTATPAPAAPTPTNPAPVRGFGVQGGGGPQFVGTNDLREDIAKYVHECLKSIYVKLGFGGTTLTIMDIMEARQMCRQPLPIHKTASSSSSNLGADGKRKIEYVISHNFSSNEIIDMVATINTTLTANLREYPIEYVDQVCKFVEKSFAKVPLSGHRPAASKKPLDLLNYFKSCKNPLISPGFIIPVDLFPLGSSASERVDGLINATTMPSMKVEAVPVRSLVTTSSGIEHWQSGGLNLGPLLTSSKHPTSASQQSDGVVAANEYQALAETPSNPTTTTNTAVKSEYFNKVTDLLNQVREDTQAVLREILEAEPSLDGVDVAQLVEDMLRKYMPIFEQEAAANEIKGPLSSADQLGKLEIQNTNAFDKTSNKHMMEIVTKVTNIVTSTLLSNPSSIDDEAGESPVEAMKGWTPAINPDHEWSDPRTCLFCGEDENDENKILGRLLPFSDGAFVHVNCIMWCQEVEEKNNLLVDAYNARDRVIHQHCYLCRKRGASLNCCQTLKRCRRAFHVKCAIACSSLLLMRPHEPSTGTNGNNTEKNQDSEKSSPNKSRFVMTCPAHVDCVLKIKPNTKGRPTLTFTQGLKQLVPWAPSQLNRCLMIERQDPAVELQTLSTVLAQRRNDKAAKSGAVTVLNLGHPSVPDAILFATPSYIYPYGFRSSRIYWSMIEPGVRTVYLFEVLSLAETEDWDLQQVEYLQDMLELMEHSDGHEKGPDSDKTNAMMVDGEDTEGDVMLTATQVFAKPDPNAMVRKDLIGLLSAGGNGGPLFRCIALDNPSTPLFARHVHQLYNYIMQGVDACRSKLLRQSNKLSTSSSSPTAAAVDLSMKKLRHAVKSRPSWNGYGMTPAQFFGLGLPFTRCAMEHIPESIASMIIADNQSRYRPVYKLPSDTEISASQQLINSLKGGGNAGQSWNSGMAGLPNGSNGSTRADPYVAKYNGVSGTRLTRILTKVVDNNENSEGGEDKETKAEEEDDQYAADLEKEGNRADIEARIQKFIDMSVAYMINPYTKLEVRKSPIHGWGLFAKMNFQRDDVIVEYMGEKIRQVIADRREVMYEKNGVGSCYLFRLDKDEIIDATATGAMARFINHCCEPNAYARIISYYKNDIEEKHIVIMAARDIQEGEEITYDYKFPIEEKKLKCYCGAPKCSGAMN